MSVVINKVNLDTLPADEASAIRAAEDEAADFYGTIEAEETERARLSELHKVCGLMWGNRFNAVSVVTESFADHNLFSETEKTTILTIADKLHPDEAYHFEPVIGLRFSNDVATLNRTMKAGYYFENLPATELLARHAA